MLWAIPKNLVYIFLFVIVFAFFGMLYVTYTEKNMAEFISYDRATEVVVVDPLFLTLRVSMDLDKDEVEVIEASQIDPVLFNEMFLTRNRPVVIRNYAKGWGATKKWNNKDYLAENGAAVSNLSRLQKGLKDDRPFSFYSHPSQRNAVSWKHSMDQIANNENYMLGGQMGENNQTLSPRVHFLDRDLLRFTPTLRQDYELPMLQEFLRLQATLITIWPTILTRPVQFMGESFMCVVDGTEKVHMVSPVFKQNLYQGVFDDLSPAKIPEDINFFAQKAGIFDPKYPLLNEISKDFILKATLKKGDCLYIPFLWWVQSQAADKESTFLTFNYEPSSKLTALLFDAISK